MTRRHNLKTAMAGLVAASALALGATAQAVTLDAGVFAVGQGDAANPIVINVPNPGQPTGGGLFTDTVNFDLGPFTHFNMTSTNNNVSFFASTIFQNDTDAEISDPVCISGCGPGETPVLDPRFPIPGYTGGADTFTSLALPDLGLFRDYHLHPGGIENAGASYTLTLWGSNAPGGPAVPIPAAAWLFGSGVIGLAGLARRKMAASV
ncbi:MAG: hypothetical protein CV089_01070 [Nitrospira sp. WS110]|nr:hypothetical protein [Nitrospira sp. WS110]